MSDLDHLYADRVRKALVLRDGKLDFDAFTEELVDMRRELHGLPTSVRRLEI